MKFDEDLVQRCYETIEAWGNPFSERDSLVQICSGLEATPLVQEDLLDAENKGKIALTSFVESRIKSNTTDFYSPIKKQRLVQRSFCQEGLETSLGLEFACIETVDSDTAIYAVYFK